MNICPNCIEPLKPQYKKLGAVRRWLVCLTCGYRTRPEETDFGKAEIQIEVMKKQNTNNHFKDYDQLTYHHKNKK